MEVHSGSIVLQWYLVLPWAWSSFPSRESSHPAIQVVRLRQPAHQIAPWPFTSWTLNRNLLIGKLLGQLWNFPSLQLKLQLFLIEPIRSTKARGCLTYLVSSRRPVCWGDMSKGGQQVANSMDKIWEGHAAPGGPRKDFGFSLSEMGSHHRMCSRGMTWVDHGLKRFWKIGTLVLTSVILVPAHSLEHGKCLIN